MMRLARVRFTVRRMMIVVAIVALLTAGEIMRRRSQSFQMTAILHEVLEKGDRSSLGADVVWLRRRDYSVEIMGAVPDMPSLHLPSHHVFPGEVVGSIRQCAEYHSRMRAKYEAAARRPWLVVEPDPILLVPSDLSGIPED